MKKIISLFTTLSIVFSMLGTFTVFAEDSAADLEISTIMELEAFRDDVNSGNTYEGKTVKLTANIDMSEKYGEDRESWTAIGTKNTQFQGTFDGQGHTISGLYINNTKQYQGLFGYVRGTITNLTADGFVSSSTDDIGGIVGCIIGTVSKCNFSGTVYGKYDVGGIIGWINGGQVSDCNNSAVISAQKGNAGGVIGYSNGGTLTNCHNTGAVSGNDSDVGGVVGDTNAVITDCYNTGAVNGTYTAGGIVGRSGGTISMCYNTGSVTGSSGYIGGVVGTNNNTVTNCYNTGTVTGTNIIGGIIGSNSKNVINCYNTGAITATGSFGGIAGHHTVSQYVQSEMSSCYYLDTTASNGYDGTDTENWSKSLIITEFADKSNFLNWDFDIVWKMDTSLGRPVLRSNMEKSVHTHDMSVDCGNENAIVFDKALTSDTDGNLLINGIILEPTVIENRLNFTYLDIPAGNYYLADNVTLNTHIEINSDVNICLNGKTLDLGNKRIEISKSYHDEKKSLSLCDCGENGTITSQYSSSDINFAIIQSQSEFSMYGGKIINTGNKTTGHYTSAVSVAPLNGQAVGTVRLYGGEIVSINDTALAVPVGNGVHTIISGSPKIKGKSSDIETRNSIIFDAPLTVTEPYRIKLMSSKPFTIGWNTYMKDKNISDYFICASKGFYINKNVDGELERYEYGIIEQPSAENNYTFSVSGEPVSYQWYPASVVTEAVTDQNVEVCEGCIYDNGTKSWWSFRDYFKIDLLTGDIVKITALQSMNSTAQVGMMCDGEIVYAEKNGDDYILTADRGGAYIIYILFSIDPDNIDISGTSITAEVTKKVLGEAVNGQTTNQFMGGDGKYICKVTYADGTVLTSDIISVKSTHIHNWGEWSITTEPTFDKTGKAERICLDNNTHKDTVNLPVLTDKTVWTEGLKIEPTETENGSVTYTSQYGNVQIIIPAFLGETFPYEIMGLVLRDSDTLPENSDFVVKYSITQIAERNTNEYDKFFVAAYDTDGELICVSLKNVRMSVGQILHLGYLIEPNDKKVGSIKAFAWDGFNSMKPLAKTKTLVF